MTQVWQDEYQAWRKRSLAGTDYVYIWADGVYFNVRLEEDRLTCLAVMGVRAGVEFKDGEQVLHYYQVAPLVLEQVPVEAAA